MYHKQISPLIMGGANNWPLSLLKWLLIVVGTWLSSNYFLFYLVSLFWWRIIYVYIYCWEKGEKQRYEEYGEHLGYVLWTFRKAAGTYHNYSITTHIFWKEIIMQLLGNVSIVVYWILHQIASRQNRKQGNPTPKSIRHLRPKIKMK